MLPKVKLGIVIVGSNIGENNSPNLQDLMYLYLVIVCHNLQES